MQSVTRSRTTCLHDVHLCRSTLHFDLPVCDYASTNIDLLHLSSHPPPFPHSSHQRSQFYSFDWRSTCAQLMEYPGCGALLRGLITHRKRQAPSMAELAGQPVETVDSATASSSSALSSSVDIPTTSSSEPASLVKSTLDLLVGGFGLLTDYYDLTIVKCVSLCRWPAQAGWHSPLRQAARSPACFNAFTQPRPRSAGARVPRGELCAAPRL